MKPTITGNDGVVRDVRKVRCMSAAAWKKSRKAIAVQYAKSGIEGYAEFSRKIRCILLRSKNAPLRYARRSARLSAERAA